MVIALAVDLGASGGKAFTGRFDGRQLEVHEIYRFPPTTPFVSPAASIGTSCACYMS